MSAAEKSTVGIEKIAAYPCSLSLDMAELARRRGMDPDYPQRELWVRTRSLNPLWEDAVTMAVNAARWLVDEEDRERIGLIVVGTESSPDFGKPISTYVQRYCQIGANCRNFETKHACYGGTAALMMAAHWVVSGYNRGTKALVIATDQSRMHLGEPWEYVLGAGSVAMLVSTEPQVLELELEHTGYWTNEVSDTYRPTSTAEVGNADTSLYCYFEALENAYVAFRCQMGEFDFATHFKKSIYHMPFGGMSERAHRTLLRLHGRMSSSQMRKHFVEHSLPTLAYTAQCGGTYSGSTFLALMGLIDSCEDLCPGDRISIFAYGSGSCGEFYSARIGTRARQVVAGADLQKKLDARLNIDVAIAILKSLLDATFWIFSQSCFP